MAFTTALSGLAAASNNLAVTGNNIANSNTTGFKRSRSEFVDVFATSFGGVSSTTPGSGVRVANVAQQFDQGNLDITSNNLDLAISGQGFFVLAESPSNLNSKLYTRSGEFKLDKDSTVVNNQGNPLLVFQSNGSGGFNTGVMTSISLSTQQGLPKATTSVTMQVNVDANDTVLAAAASTPTAAPPRAAIGAGGGTVPAPAVGAAILVDETAFIAFDPTDATTYTAQTSVTTYDTLGVAHTLTSYFIAGQPVAGGREWGVFNYLDGNAVGVPAAATPAVPSTLIVGGLGGAGVPTADHVGQTLVFDSLGQLTSPTTGLVDLNPIGISTAATLDLQVNYANSTQFSALFSVDNLTQNGLPSGQLTGIDIDDEGVVFARFSNGASNALGKVALTRFPNPQGMTALGDTTWAQSSESGEPIPGEAGSNNFGIIQSGSLEASNVDLAKQLVNLIIAQQTYQANSETIATENTIIQTILNI